MFWAEIWKISEFLSENFQFLVMKFSIYLNRRVFIMKMKFWVKEGSSRGSTEPVGIQLNSPPHPPPHTHTPTTPHSARDTTPPPETPPPSVWIRPGHSSLNGQLVRGLSYQCQYKCWCKNPVYVFSSNWSVLTIIRNSHSLEVRSLKWENSELLNQK